MTTNRMRLALGMVIGAALIAGASHAQSRRAAQLPDVSTVRDSIRVSYADLDIYTPVGLSTLRGRINNAAVQVCRFDDRGMLEKPIVEIGCRRDARIDAWDQYAENQARRLYANAGDVPGGGALTTLALVALRHADR